MGTAYILESRASSDLDWGNRRKVGHVRMLLAVGRFMSAQLGHGYNFRIKNRGGDYGPWRTHGEIFDRVKRRTNFNDFGFKCFINRKRDGRTLSIHKIETIDPIPNLGCHSEIEKAYYLLRQRFGPYGVRNGGIWYCRYVDGTYVVSRHGFLGEGWKGAAGDVFSSPDTMSALVDRAYFLRAQCREGKLHLDRIIVGQTYWDSRDNFANAHYYSGAYHRHIHMEVWSGGACDP